ncbi:unnamed protein product [Urochloa humidicola]
MAWTALPLLMAVAAILGGSTRCFASDTISAESAVSGNRTIVSRGGRFELGFFSPAGSSGHSYYVGIWYKVVSQCTPVWVANRAAPVSDPASSKLAVAADGNLILVNEAGKLVWSTNVRSTRSAVVVVVILDTGNLVLRCKDDGEVLWQSAEHPTNTWLPGGRFGMNKITGDVQALDGPEREHPVLHHLGQDRASRDQRGVGRLRPQHIHRGLGQVGLRVRFRRQRHLLHLLRAGTHGDLQVHPRRLRPVDAVHVGAVRHRVDDAVHGAVPDFQLCPFNICGAFGICSHNGPEPSCSCPAGFHPSSEGEWELLGDRSQEGCRRNNPLRCTTNSSVHSKDDGGDAFLLAPGISLPANNAFYAHASSAQDCRLACLRSCNCTAYSYGSLCSLWYDDLLNLQRVDDTTGMYDLYIRLSAMDVPSEGHKRTAVFVSIAASVASILALAVMVSVAVIIRTFVKRRQRSITFVQAASEGGDLVAFKYSDVRAATRNFSEKLGGGGFGSVYKGTLPGSRAAIAVKKLEGRANLCGVGEKQFISEVRTIGVIQHINLVCLRGFCSQGGDRLLVYDHMPNGSLDKALFTGAPAPVLSWPERFRIAVGAARGLLYLHKECRDCIIHCDIKPENILLDAELVPKVADFGMAKLVGRDFSRVLTTVRGTIGYLSPEWIAGVPITAKADVYSYGMVLLEIVSGRRNARCLEDTEQEGPSFSGYFPLVAARMVSQGGALAGLLDERLRGDADAAELERVCKVACWCVQDDEAWRPTMEQVVRALEGVVAVDVPPVPRSLQALVQGSGSVTSARTSACFASMTSQSDSHLGAQNSS